MFDLIFDGMMAFQSIMLLVGALFCLGLGALLSSDFINWRTNARRVKGKIITFRQKDGNKQTFYYPVAEFRNEKGEMQKVTSDVGSSHLDQKKVGQSVTILYFPNKTGKARILGSGWPIFVIGLILICAGVFMGYHALLVFEFNPITLTVAILLGAVAFFKFEKIKKPMGQMKSLKALRESGGLLPRDDEEGNTSASREMSQEDIRKVHKDFRRQQANWSWFVLLFGIAMLGIGSTVGYSIWDLEENGLSASGKVIGLEANDSDDGVTYAPIVRYETQEGRTVKFTSNYSSNPPSYKKGDEVDVLYNPQDPEEDVMIDAGWWNWVIPYSLLAVGFFLCLFVFPKMRSEASKAL